MESSVAFSTLSFVLTIGFLFLKSAGVEYLILRLILLIVSNMGGLAIFYMLLNQASRRNVETFVNEKLK